MLGIFRAGGRVRRISDQEKDADADEAAGKYDHFSFGRTGAGLASLVTWIVPPPNDPRKGLVQADPHLV